MQRRAQQPITIRSDRAAARLRVLTAGGRSQAAVIEEALAAMPVPGVDPDQRTRIAEIQAQFKREKTITMAEFDAREYDANGNLR